MYHLHIHIGNKNWIVNLNFNKKNFIIIFKYINNIHIKNIKLFIWVEIRMISGRYIYDKSGEILNLLISINMQANLVILQVLWVQLIIIFNGLYSNGSYSRLSYKV